MLAPLKFKLMPIANLSRRDIDRKQMRLLDALLHPNRTSDGVIPIEVFAHGPEAIRLARVAEDQNLHAHWAVQIWSASHEDWLTVKSYPFKDALTGVALRNLAYQDAKDWYPQPPVDELIEKWSAVNTSDQDEFDRLFSSREKLAEFWYDTKGLNWEDVPGGDPWPFMSAVAQKAFNPDSPEQEGMTLSNPKRAEKVQAILSNFALQWGEFAPPVFHVTFLEPGSKEFFSLAQFPTAQDAADEILTAAKDVVVKLCQSAQPHEPYRLSWAIDIQGHNQQTLTLALTNLFNNAENAEQTQQAEAVVEPTP